MIQIVVVDMDGCLCALNSFRYWLVFSLLFSLLTLRWGVFSCLIRAALLRVFRRCNRVQMKKRVLLVTENFPNYFKNWFGFFLRLFTNPDVLSEMKKYEGMDVQLVLNTASPDCYVNIYAKNFNFDQVFSSPYVRAGGWKENIGQEKVESLRLFYGNVTALVCVLTDHHDDLPLLLLAKKRIVVRPSVVTLARLTKKFEFDTI